MAHPTLIPCGADKSARGEFLLAYKHPADLHLTPIFDEVSMEFLCDYAKRRRDFFIGTTEFGWKWFVSTDIKGKWIVQPFFPVLRDISAFTEK